MSEIMEKLSMAYCDVCLELFPLKELTFKKYIVACKDCLKDFKN